MKHEGTRKMPNTDTCTLHTRDHTYTRTEDMHGDRKNIAVVPDISVAITYFCNEDMRD